MGQVTWKLKRPSSARAGQRLGIGQGDAGRGVVGLHGQFAAAAVHQHRQLDAGRPAEVEQFVEHGADGAAGVQHVVQQHDVRAVDVERQHGLRAGCRQAALREIVAVHGRGDDAGVAVQAQVLLQALGQPGAARRDAHQPRPAAQHAGTPRSSSRYSASASSRKSLIRCSSGTVPG
jgi:hypothetical protein